MKCHCGSRTTPHEGAKAGYAHCNACGCCLDADGRIRDGHPACAEYREPAQRHHAPSAKAPEDSDTPGDSDGNAGAATTDVPLETTKGGTKDGVSDADAKAPEDSDTPERRTKRGA